MSFRRLLSLAVTSAVLVRAQYGPYGEDAGSFPHVYPGIPSGDFSPEWQNYFQVTERLPNVTFDLGRNWAGNIPVGRAGHPNNTIFFWAFEKENGSLTAAVGERNDEPWGIYIDTPGLSSLFGFAFLNGPIQIASDFSVHKNDFSWDRLADWVWIDTPLGTGLSTADAGTQAVNEEQAAEDFIGFLTNLVEVFPSLKTRPLYLVGNGGATLSITYFAKHYFNLPTAPVSLRKMVLGNPSFGTSGAEASLMTVINTYPQLIQYNTDVYQYFQGRINDCGYHLNLTYPPSGKYPTLHFAHSNGNSPRNPVPLKGEFVCGGLFNELTVYASGHSPPWNTSAGTDSRDIRNALNPFANLDGTVFFNDDATRAALHAPLSRVKQWFWDNNLDTNVGDFYITSPSDFLDELATNTTKHDIAIVVYNGNDDLLGGHGDTELHIQNATFGGAQGFTRKPATAWTDDDGQFAGIVHQERNWTYVLVFDEGRNIPRRHPERASVMLREFILGNNQTGLVTEVNGQASVVGGEDSSLYSNGILRGEDGIFTGSGTTQGVYTYPTATIEAWNSFTATAFATATPTATNKVSARFRNPV